MPEAPLPLTQEIAAWMLQALGLVDDVAPSRSTVKSALRGKEIPRSWESLMVALPGAFGVETPAEQRSRALQSLRALDAKATSLDTCDLPLELRMPAVLRRLIPEVGVRFGAVAALVDHGLLPRAQAALPDLAEWLTEPLSPRVFGRVVEGLLVHHHPELRTWEQRMDTLKRRGVAGKSTVRRWREPGIAVPNPSSIAAFVEKMAGEEQAMAEGLLRLGRLLTVAQQDLGDQVEPVREAVSLWARTTREMLRQPANLADLADMVAAVMESEHGPALLAASRPYWGDAVPDDSAAAAAPSIRGLAQAVRETGDVGPLLFLLIQQISMPYRVLVGAVGVLIGAWPDPSGALFDPFERIQAEWQGLAVVHHLAEGASGKFVAPDGSERSILMSDAQQAHAARLRDASLRIVRGPDDAGIDDMDVLRLTLPVLTQAMGPAALPMVAEVMNTASAERAVPVALEPHLPEEVVEAMPHLMLPRAIRHLDAGKHDDALSWMNRRIAAKLAWSGSDRMKAARVVVGVADRWLDEVPNFVGIREELAPLLGSNKAVDDAILELEGGVKDVAESTRSVCVELFEVASGLLANVATDSEAERVVLLVPLAVRLDALDAWIAGTEDVAPTRSAPLAETLEALLARHPTHPGLWAQRAAWQELVGEDPSDATKKAEHFGGGAALATLRKKLAADGLIDPG